MQQNNRSKMKTVLALAGVLLLFSGCSMFPEEEEALAPPLKQPVEVEYTTAEAAVGTIKEEISDTCTAVATNQYTLSFGERSGILRSKQVAVGDTVKKGQVIATLDRGDAETKLEKERINLKMLQVNLERAQSKGLPDIDTKGNAVNFDVELVKLQIEQSTLNIQGLEQELADTTVYAPIDGVVTSLIDANIGDNIAVRAVICQVADNTTLSFEYTGFKSDKLKFGMDAILVIDGKEYAGKVSGSKDSVAEADKTAFDGKVRFSAEGLPALKLGKQAQFKVVTAVKDNVVLVPRSALTGSSGSYYVSIFKDGIKSERAVDIGILTASQAEIIKGVEAGEQVVTK